MFKHVAHNSDLLRLLGGKSREEQIVAAASTTLAFLVLSGGRRW